MPAKKENNRAFHTRLLAIDRMIRQGHVDSSRDPVNCATLARKWEVSAKTIQRDIDHLRDVEGAPLEYDRAEKRFYYAGSFALSSVRLTENEMFGVFLADEAMKRYRNTPLHAPLQSAFRKITEALPETVSVDATWLDGRISFQNEPSATMTPEIWTTMSTSLKDHLTVNIVYQKPAGRGTDKRPIDPYHMTYSRGDWYVIAHCHLRKERRMFNLARIRSAVLTKTPFTVPDDFDVAKYFDLEHGTLNAANAQDVTIYFDAKVASYIAEKSWFRNQTIKENTDGSLILKGQAYHPTGLQSWILSWGPHARVIAPAALATTMKADLLAAAQQY